MSPANRSLAPADRAVANDVLSHLSSEDRVTLAAQMALLREQAHMHISQPIIFDNVIHDRHYSCTIIDRVIQFSIDDNRPGTLFNYGNAVLTL